MARSGDTGGADRGGAGNDPGTAAVRRRAALASVVALLVLTAAAAGVWWVTVARSASPGSPAVRAELDALDAKLAQVRGALDPIARSFTSEPETGLIDVGAYRDRIEAARRVVDGVNGVEVSDPGALQVRDLIVTGGSEVLAGMDAALDALGSDDASATEPAGAQVDEGLSKLQEASDMLDSLLGRSSVTRGSGDRLYRDAAGA